MRILVQLLRPMCPITILETGIGKMVVVQKNPKGMDCLSRFGVRG
jgi:tRNA(Arg) A34 adenosine deaminase TadA